MKAYFIGGGQDLTVRFIPRVEGVFRFVKMDWLGPSTPFMDDGPTLAQVSQELDVYRLRAQHQDVAIYVHEDLLK